MFQYILKGKDGSGFGSWKTVPAVPVPLSFSAKTVPTVPVPGSGSVLSHPEFQKSKFHPQIFTVHFWSHRVLQGPAPGGEGKFTSILQFSGPLFSSCSKMSLLIP